MHLKAKNFKNEDGIICVRTEIICGL